MLVVGLDEPHIEQTQTDSKCLLKQTRHVHLVWSRLDDVTDDFDNDDDSLTFLTLLFAL